MKIEQFTEELTQKLMSFCLGENTFGVVFPQGNIIEVEKIENALIKAGGKPKDCDLDDYDKGGSGKAKPEFIITFNNDTNTIIVIECKKQTRYHSSELHNKPNQYAVDGALYYAKFLKKYFNVIAIGVSGTEVGKTNLSVYYWGKNHEKPQLQEKLNDIFLSPDNYLKAINGEKISKQYSLDEIRETALIFHDKLRSIKLSEKQKPIFIAGILIALEDPDFLNSYFSLNSFNSIITLLNESVSKILTSSDIRKENIDNVRSSFKQIGSNPKLKDIPLGQDGSLKWYIEQLEMKIKPMMNNANSSLDALGIFYHEFVKYSGGDGKGLGIVLTPQHLTEFMCDLAEINKKSHVVDITCGSASFLVTAMNKMFKETANPNELDSIRSNQLYGIELDPDLYILAIANMIIRKDGKSNIIHGDCFSQKTINLLKIASNNELDVGLLNPPYSQKDHQELEFAEQLLDLINKGGKAVIVVPMSSAIGTKFKEVRKRLFEKHTLKAVFSMPDDVFYPTGTNVCVMVWEAHKPHSNNIKTFFGYYKDDGFVKRKKLGRIDAYDQWGTIKKQWLDLYNNSEVIEGLSAKQEVSYNDEWLAEAYMKTNYNLLSQIDFEITVRSYMAFLIKYGLVDLNHSNFDQDNNEIPLSNVESWGEFPLIDLFNVTGSKTTKLDDLKEIGAGIYPYVTTQAVDNAVAGFYDWFTEKGNVITVDSAVLGFSAYQIQDFSASDHVEVLRPKFHLNKYIAIFICTILNKESFRYSYGRKCSQTQLRKTNIKLPSKNGAPDWEYIESFVKQLPYAHKI